MLNDYFFDLFQFNPMSSDFHLKIKTAQKLNTTIWMELGSITGLVKTISRVWKWILNEAFRC